jgi:hypothetical protein
VAQFGHASRPWTSWSVLAEIELAAGNPAAAAGARNNAITCYLAYRRDGGENHDAEGRLCLAVTKQILTGDPSAAASLLAEPSADTELPSHARTFIEALQAIVAGSRDRTLAYTSGLGPSMAAEILFLLETLERPR